MSENPPLTDAKLAPNLSASPEHQVNDTQVDSAPTNNIINNPVINNGTDHRAPTTQDAEASEMVKRFRDFPIHPAILDAVAQMGWDQCTPIQAQTLDLTLAGCDVAGKAKTGTGKTAAFLIAAYHYLMVNPVLPDEDGPWCLVLAPTRELAQQIYDDALQIGCYTGLQAISILGGKDYDEQKQILAEKKPALIIGTPGRIIDLYKQRLFSLKQIDVLVLDEADRMFDLGFIQDIRYLLKQMPEASTRLNLIFSATFNTRVQELAYEHLNAPELISVYNEEETEAKAEIEQTLYHLEEKEKPALLVGLLRQLQAGEKAVVFVNTKRILERLSATLDAENFSSTGLSGDLAQNQRERRLAQFKAGEKSILIATDVAARGLHIDDITHVFNYDLPAQAEDYIHRIGRTARAGKGGIAISFCSEGDAYHLPDIETRLKQKIPTQRVDDSLLAESITLAYVERTSRDRDNRGGGRGDNRGNARRGPGVRSSSRTRRPSENTTETVNGNVATQSSESA